jgi:hypothetical protein
VRAVLVIGKIALGIILDVGLAIALLILFRYLP